MTASAKLTIRVTWDTLKRLMLYAQGRKLDTIIERAIRSYLEKGEKE